MDADGLRRRLRPETCLLLGNIADTVPRFVRMQTSPLGFAAIDVDLYSSTKAALKVLVLPERRILRRTFLYFDDLDLSCNHRFAGELLAIDEFNRDAANRIKIDRWRGIANGRPFADSAWLEKMYIAHDLDAISSATLTRPVARM
jgi:hypothetical protein